MDERTSTQDASCVPSLLPERFLRAIASTEDTKIRENNAPKAWMSNMVAEIDSGHAACNRVL